MTAAKAAAAKEKQRLESEMQEQKAAAEASQAALQERMEGEMTKHKAEAKAHLAETVREWHQKVLMCFFPATVTIQLRFTTCMLHEFTKLSIERPLQPICYGCSLVRRCRS